MASTNFSWILVAGLGLTTGAAGGALGTMLLLDREPRIHDPVPTRTIDPGAVENGVGALRDLASEVRLLRESMPASVPLRSEAPGNQRVPIETAQSDRLERALERIAEGLEAQRSFSEGSRDSGGSIAADLGTHRPTRAPFKPKAADLLEDLRAVDAGVRNRPYYFWSVDEILERFGCPDEISSSEGGGWRLFYQVGEEGYVNFYFAQRLLTEIGTDRE
jgi:hypothetical protein